MSRKLIALDIVLAGVLILVGVQFRGAWKAAKARDAAATHPRITPLPVPPLPKIEPAPPVTASKYADVAQKNLFDKSRNPDVPVEPPKPAPPPPPPPPPPPLPGFFGVMVLPSGPVAILSADGRQQGIHVGENIGQYKLTAINADSLTLEWNGQTFVKSTDELSNRAKQMQPQAAPAETARTANAPPATAPPPEPVKPGPGVETPYGIRVCNMNDGMPEGAVMDGYVKRVYTSPFGKTCGWERVR